MRRRALAIPKGAKVALVVGLAAALLQVGMWIGDDEESRRPGRPRSPTSPQTTREADDPLEVMMIWGPAEEPAFRHVVEAFPEARVTVIPVPRDIGAALDQRIMEGNPPDVAIIPQPSLVGRYAHQGRLVPMSDDVLAPIDGGQTGRFPEQWQALTRFAVGGAPPDEYAAFVEATHKSLFWYQADSLGSVPESWTLRQMIDWLHGETRAPPSEAPLTLAAGDRGPLTDWFENELAALDPELYDRLATACETSWDHDAVRQALSDMADVWSTQGVFHGGPDGVAAYQGDQFTRRVGRDQGTMAFASSSLAGPVEQLPVQDQPRPFEFPGVGAVRPLVVGGDLAVVLQQPNPGAVDRAQRFVDWLTRPEALRRWSEVDASYLAPNLYSPLQPDGEPSLVPEEDVRIWLTWHLTHPPGGRLFFDLSDQFGVVAQGDSWVALDIFLDFFLGVTGRRAVRDPYAEVVDQLDALALNPEWQPQVDC